MKLAIALFTRSRDAPTIPASSSWVTGQDEVVDAVGELEDPLRRAAGDVEEHGIGECLVHHAEALGQQAGDVPQHRRMFVEHLDDRGVGHGEHSRRLQRPGHRRARPIVEQAELAEQVTLLHQGDHTLAAVDRIAQGDRQATRCHHVQGIGRITLVEQHVATDEVAFLAVAGERVEDLGRGVGEELGARQDVTEGSGFVGHAASEGSRSAAVYVRRRCARCG